MTDLSLSELPDGPRYSIVAAVYNVARYLDEFIASIDQQTLDQSRFEVVVVDDGSTDDSLARLQQWAAQRPNLVTVVTKSNGGQATARNVGLEHARGEWVTFTDPDDVLAADYLEQVDRFLLEHPETPMAATYRVFLDDATGAISDTHPLRVHFAGASALRELDGWPNYFHGSAPAAFFRRSVIENLGLRFDPDVRPNFEDGHFSVRYLLAQSRPAVGFVKKAVYKYRKRSDATSTLQTSLADPDRYTKVLRNGYLAVLQQSMHGRKRAPEWLQNLIIYELSWYFTSQDVHAAAGGSASGSVAEQFHALMAQICAFLEPHVVNSFRLRALRPTLRFILLHSYTDPEWRQDYGLLDRVDMRRGLARVRYHFTGSPPDEMLLIGGSNARPAAAKTRAVTYHDRTLLRERILWVSTRSTVRLTVDGQPLRLTAEADRLPRYGMSPSVLGKQVSSAGALPSGSAQSSKSSSLNRRDSMIVRLARTTLVRRRFADAWVLMDRIHNADDSGEILFRYLRKRRPNINAWFVVEGGTSDYQRLRAAGYKRVVAHGSTLWKLLMLNARHLISSHADLPVIAPPEIVRLVDPTWQFTFLQHGVIKDDLSGWLNPKAIDTFVTSTPKEYDSIAGDENAYVFTSKEVRLTGLPRFDKLLRIGMKVAPERRDLILLTPTWRQWLLPPLVRGSQRRTLSPDFFESEFAREWLGLLQSSKIAQLCHEHGLKVGFLPHPNLESAVPGLNLPSHVEALTYEVPDVQQHFARAAVLVTDYSSIAFNAAYIERPVVYFQFDADKVLGGAHVGRAGYFSYPRDGFGPVTRTLCEAEEAIATTVRAGREPEPFYLDRINMTFPQRDGRCCKRVTEAILASERRWKPSAAS